MKGMKVTNKDVLEFLAKKDKSEDYPRTAEYMSNLELTGNDNYIGLVKTFCSNGMYGDEGDKKFYCWLDKEKKLKYNGIESLSVLVEKDPDFVDTYVLLDDKKIEDVLKDPLLQKWHLFVSWAAYKEFKGKSDIFNRPLNFRCRELLLWMCEASAGSDVAKEFLTDCPGWIGKIQREIRKAIIGNMKDK